MKYFIRNIFLILVFVTYGCSDKNSIKVNKMDQKFYRIMSIDVWGDYGNILVNGMTGHLGEKDGYLQLERAGPFIPPISFPGLSDLVVTDELKRKIETSGLGVFEFRPVIKARIVDLSWESFDRNAKEPPIYPNSGEPADYILERPHSASIANTMGDIWQVSLHDGAIVDTDQQRGLAMYDVRVHVSSWNGDHLFYGKKPEAFFGRWIIVSEEGKRWFEEHAGAWVRFEELTKK